MLIDNRTPLIIESNGDTVRYKSITLPSNMNAAVRWIKLDGKKVDAGGMVAVQDGRCYYATFHSVVGDLLVKQIKRGKINLFCFDSKTINGYVTTFVVQKGNEPLAQVNIPGMAARLQDNKIAYARFVRQFGNHPKKVFATDLSKHPKAVLEAVDIYNGGA